MGKSSKKKASALAAEKEKQKMKEQEKKKKEESSSSEVCVLDWGREPCECWSRLTVHASPWGRAIGWF